MIIGLRALAPIVSMTFLIVTGCGGSESNDGVTATHQQPTTPIETDCSTSEGAEDNIQYRYSLDKGTISFTNANECDALYLWAKVEELISNYGAVSSIGKALLPGESIDFALPNPSQPEWGHVLVLSLENSNTIIFMPPYFTRDRVAKVPAFLVDTTDTIQGTLPGYSNIYAFRDDNGNGERRWGQCHSFNWIDKFSGTYQIAPDYSGAESLCSIGNISGYLENGQLVTLPGIRYFATDTSQFVTTQ